jgi:hypothetical protein
MKDFDYRLLPETGMALMTARDIDGSSPMYLADFKDNQVLSYRPTGHFIGFSSQLGLRLCKGPPKMLNGMWIVHDDPVANEKHVDVKLASNLLDFIPI